MESRHLLPWFTFSILFLSSLHIALSISELADRINVESKKHLVVKAYSPDRQITSKTNSISKSPQDFTSWSFWSKCTRSCGGGISIRRRICLVSNCEVATQEFLVCNVMACPNRYGDYRSEQCTRRNGRNIAGNVSRKWIPLPGYNQCELKCKSVDFADTYVFGKVEDGTKCGPTHQRVCLNGRCMPVGCDFIIGSSRNFDKCGVCGGHNSTCKQIRGTYKQKAISWNSDENYQEIVKLPEGAYDILVTDNTSNYLSLKDSGGNFVINGNKTIGWPGTYDLGGTIANYSRVGHEERLFIQGPIRENFVVTTFIVDSTPGIKYQFLIPKYNQRKVRMKNNGGGRGYPIYRQTPGESSTNQKKPPRPRPNIKNELGSFLPKGYNDVMDHDKTTIDRNEISRSTPPMPSSPSYEKPYRQTPPPFSAVTQPVNNRGWKGSISPLPGQNTTTRRIKNERDPNRTDTEANRRNNKKKGKCPPCERIKNRFKNFCTSDFVIKGKILNNYWFPDKQSKMKDTQYDVHVIETYKTSKDLVLNAREYLFIPSSDLCACPKLRKNVEYIIMGKIDKNFRKKEDRLIIDSNSFIRKFSEKRHLEIMKVKQQQYDRCHKYLPTTKRYKKG